jgi:hypothetical protein
MRQTEAARIDKIEKRRLTACHKDDPGTTLPDPGYHDDEDDDEDEDDERDTSDRGPRHVPSVRQTQAAESQAHAAQLQRKAPRPTTRCSSTRPYCLALASRMAQVAENRKRWGVDLAKVDPAPCDALNAPHWPMTTKTPAPSMARIWNCTLKGNVNIRTAARCKKPKLHLRFLFNGLRIGSAPGGWWDGLLDGGT